MRAEDCYGRHPSIRSTIRPVRCPYGAPLYATLREFSHKVAQLRHPPVHAEKDIANRAQARPRNCISPYGWLETHTGGV